MSVLLASALLLSSPGSFDAYTHGPYDPAVATPEATLGYPIGQRHTTFREQEIVLRKLAAEAPERLRWIDYGKTVEGRPLKVLAISTPANIARLEDIRKSVARLASGTLARPDAAKLAAETPAIVWINECIHGDETASFEAAMWTAYTLCASRSPEIQKVLDRAVVILNPAYNPDGHERYVVYNNATAVGSAEREAFENREPDIIVGRTNHYRFDMNRDRVALSQPESRQEVAEFLRWTPQVYVDQHGETSEYFFPPNPMALNVNVDRARINRWTDLFGRMNGQAFDRRGWSYFTRSEFDLYYAGYLDSFTSLHGAVGMTYETDGGFALRTRKDDGSELTLRDGAAKHFTAALTTIQTAATHRDELLTSFAEFRRQSADGSLAGDFGRVVVTAPDSRALVRLRDQLERGGVRTSWSAQPFSQPQAHDYWSSKVATVTVPAGALIVDMNQPSAAFAKALLEPGQDFEKEFTDRQLAIGARMRGEKQYPPADPLEFYDTTGWCVIYAHGLQAYWSPQRVRYEATAAPTPTKPGQVGASEIGWWFPYRDRDDILAAAELARADYRVRQTAKTMALSGETVPAGAFFLYASRNPEDLKARLEALQKSRGIAVRALASGYPEIGRESPGAGSSNPVVNPIIGVVFGSADETTEFGGAWYALEREYDLPFTPIHQRSLSRSLDKYSAILFPPGNQPAIDARLRQWVSEGHTLVSMSTNGWLMGKEGLVDLKPNQVKRDRGASEPKPLPGTLYRAEADPESFLLRGYTDALFAAPVDGSTFLGAPAAGGGALTIERDPKKVERLSGWEWPDDSRDALANSVIVYDQPVGNGHVIMFMIDPLSRAMWPQFDKMVLNALILGPNVSGSRRQ